MKAVITALVIVTGFLGCSVGEVPATGTGADAAPVDPAGEASFNAQVAPRVMGCAIPGCHVGLNPPNLTSYGGLEAKYKMKPGMTNILVTKGDMQDASGPPGLHYGLPYLDETAKSAIAAWIDGLSP